MFQLLIKTDNLFSNCHAFKFLLLCRFTFNIFISITIDLLKQIWFPLARKDSQMKGFVANWITSMNFLFLATLWAIGKKMPRSMKVPLTRDLPPVILTVIRQLTRIWWMWKPWKDVLMRGLTEKWVILLTRSKTETKTQYWPQLKVLLLLKSN